MNHINAIECHPTIVGGQEIHDRMTAALGPMQRCVTLYDDAIGCPRWWDGEPHPVFGCIPTPRALRIMFSELRDLARSKGVTPADLVMLNCEYTPMGWQWATDQQKSEWTKHVRSTGPWAAFQSMFVGGYDARTYDAACTEMYASMVGVFPKGQAFFYNVHPGMENGSPQHARWAALVGRHTHAIYPVEGAIFPRPDINNSLNPTLIQSPVYVRKESKVWGTPLSDEHIQTTFAESTWEGADVLWWLPIHENEQHIADGLLASGVFESMRKWREFYEAEAKDE